jgi:TonB family protein
MRLRPPVLTLCAALLAAAAGPPSFGGPPKGTELTDATVAIGYEAKSRCPELVQSETQDPEAALVVLIVGPSGVPSQASIKTSSGADALDQAALSCVARLRFLPAVRAGEGAAVAAWEEIAWKWGRAHFAQTGATGAAPAAGAPAAGIATTTASAGAARAPQAEVRVCADESGKLVRDPVVTHSSGDAGLDAAALGVARAGAPYYRPAGAAGVSGCVDLAVRFEPK